jgi:hypothetical protein
MVLAADGARLQGRWGFLNDGLGWVWRPSSGFLGSFSFSLDCVL